jgi:hypothetical protein
MEGGAPENLPEGRLSRTGGRHSTALSGRYDLTLVDSVPGASGAQLGAVAARGCTDRAGSSSRQARSRHSTLQEEAR